MEILLRVPERLDCQLSKYSLPSIACTFRKLIVILKIRLKSIKSIFRRVHDLFDVTLFGGSFLVQHLCNIRITWRWK